jgi:light-regulated signal transduction histidine kinase (bacteriophytochrome)
VPLRINEPSLSTRVIQSRQPLLIPVIDPEQIRAATKPEYASLMDRVGIHSIIGVPLRVQGQAIGALLLHRHRREQPPFNQDDLTLAQDLADRAALAISNVQMLEQLQHELTERKQAEEELKQTAAELARSNSELEQFAYVASHDLQEPLRAVAGMLQLLQQRYSARLDARADEFIGHAVEGASRMQILITDLLALSRVATRGAPFQPTDCAAILRDALANLAVAIKESGAVITHDPLPTIVADPTQLTQHFQNLIANALKFRGDEAPAIHIGVKSPQDEYLFAVCDNGIGMESQYFERIFAIFQRLHTRREYPGTGIGLALCKKIVERHGGRIWVESQPGQGSTFYFSLPDRR